MYCNTNYPTKKALKQAVADGVPVAVHQPGPFPGKTTGQIALEGPHYPQPHRWYASAEIQDSVVVPGSVK